jgi:hypothetical protein
MNRRRLALFLLVGLVILGGVFAFALTAGRPAASAAPSGTPTGAPKLIDQLRLLCTDGAPSVAGTAAYVPGTGVHPSLALMTLGGAYFQDKTTLPTEWQATVRSEVELVVCEEDSSVLIERCSFTDGQTTLDRIQNQLHVRIIATATGEVVATETFVGGMPRACGETAPTASGVQVSGSQVVEDDVRQWLRGYIAP